jgi:hypothetical protein
MSLTARLFIDHGPKDGIKVLSCSYGFSQDVDVHGKVNSRIRIGMINLTIPGISDNSLINWMWGYDATKNGEIKLSGYGDSGQRQSIKFFDGLLVSYNESFSDPSDTVINLTISCRKITVLGVTFENKWV